MTPATLAFIGDAVHTLYVRKRLAESRDCVCGTLHLAASGFVSARAQAAAFDTLTARGELTDEELEIARRARNAHLHSRAKAASPADYHKATALEAIIGALELSGDSARLGQVLDMCYSIVSDGACDGDK